MVKRVSKQQVVKQAPLVLSTDNPDAVFVKDNPDVVKTNTKGIIISDFSSGKFGVSGNAGDFTPKPEVPKDDTTTGGDAPTLADIEKIDYEEYADPTTGASKYKAIIKIRNSSKEKANISGVDAITANISGYTVYTFGDKTATGNTNTSTFVTNVTWYNASTTYNPFSGTIISGPLIIGNAQYPSDGSGVPADSTTGPTSYRTKSVWRKTQAEALTAAQVNLGGI